MMKKAVFVCLLSLALCFSQPAPKPEGSEVHQPETKAANASSEQPVPPAHVTEASVVAKSSETPHTQAISTVPTTTDTKENATKNDNKVPAQNKVEPTKKDEIKPTENFPTTAKPSMETKTDAKVTTEASTEKKVSPTSSIVPMPTSTAAPRATDKPLVQARGFDGASFVGGIILTLGLLAIGFMGYKYHKNQTERNYHTL